MTDYPPDKRAYLMATPDACIKKASEYGPFTEKFIKKILSDHAMRNLRKAQGILRLGEKHGQRALDRACERALLFGNYRYKSIKAILDKGLLDSPQESPSVPGLSPLGQSFLRPVDYFSHWVMP